MIICFYLGRSAALKFASPRCCRPSSSNLKTWVDFNVLRRNFAFRAFESCTRDGADFEKFREFFVFERFTRDSYIFLYTRYAFVRNSSPSFAHGSRPAN